MTSLEAKEKPSFDELRNSPNRCSSSVHGGLLRSPTATKVWIRHLVIGVFSAPYSALLVLICAAIEFCLWSMTADCFLRTRTGTGLPHPTSILDSASSDASVYYAYA